MARRVSRRRTGRRTYRRKTGRRTYRRKTSRRTGRRTRRTYKRRYSKLRGGSYLIGHKTGQIPYGFNGRLYAKRSDFENGYGNHSEYIPTNREANINTYTEHSHEITGGNPLEYIQIDEIFLDGETRLMIPFGFIDSFEKPGTNYTKLVLRPGKLVRHKGRMVYVRYDLFSAFDRMCEKAEPRGSTGTGTGTRTFRVSGSLQGRSGASSQGRDESPPPDGPRHNQSLGDAMTGIKDKVTGVFSGFGFGSRGD